MESIIDHFWSNGFITGGTAVMMLRQLMHIVSSVAYSVAQISQGLFFHPYQTMQSLLREKVFFWLTLLPTAIWIFVRLIWGLVIVPVVRLVFSCSQTGFWGCELLPFFTRWLFYFYLLTKLVVLYWRVRFVNFC